MAFGDILKRNIHLLISCDSKKTSKNSLWIVLRDIAVQDILNIYPNKVDSFYAIDIYYEILTNNLDKIPNYFKVILKSNNQPRYRVLNRNIWSSNAFHKEGLANQKFIKAYKTINPDKKGEMIVYQGKKNDN